MMVFQEMLMRIRGQLVVNKVISLLILLNSTIVHSKENKFINKMENIIAQKEMAYDVKLIKKYLSSDIQKYCIAKSKVPSLAGIQHLVDQYTIRVNSKDIDPKVSLKNLKLVYVEDDFECQGTVDVEIKYYNFSEQVKIPFKHNS